MKKGFTLVEILIVMAILGILLSIIIPNYSSSVKRAKEAVLKENLFIIRDAIDKFYLDKKKYPTDLEDLITNKYLKEIPFDPFLKRKEWRLIHYEPDEMEDFDPEIADAIIDVKSLASGTSFDGTKYENW